MNEKSAGRAASSNAPPGNENGTKSTARATGRSATSSTASSSSRNRPWIRSTTKSYEEHFAAHPEDLEELIRTAKSLRNPHAEATTGVDLQVPAIMKYLGRHGASLQGSEVVDIGSWKGKASHALSIRLSPLHIQATGNPKMTLEQFWQEKKCLAVWESE